MKEFNEIICILKDLHKQFPSYNLGRHLSTAFDNYPDVWGTSDKELLHALTKYKTELEMDVPHKCNDEDIENVIKGGLNLFIEEEEEY